MEIAMLSNPTPAPASPRPVATVRALDAGEVSARLPELVGILVDCVTSGASVGFMNPFGAEEAEAWWRGVTDEVAAGRTILLAAEIAGELVGTAQLIPCTKPNQPHRADVAKVLVHGKSRRRGVGSALMATLEAEARRRDLLVLTLDTVTGSSGDGLYSHAGWTRVGEIPDYALWPDGGFCATTMFYKRL
jgi:GNAT superfamily N-acetyltransferase